MSSSARTDQPLGPDRAAELRRRKLALSLELQSVEFEIENADLKDRLEKLGSDLAAEKDQNGRLREEIGAMRDQINQLQPTGPAADHPPTVFIVHGQNEAYKEAVARLIEHAIPDGRVLILHEQPNQGRAIIEKFEHYASSTSFSIVIMTGDDQGGLTSKQLSARARQNVILELGYFIAKLGRERVAVLHEESVEVPSDIHGVGYTALDAAGAWRQKLAHELSAAGLSVDFQRVR